MTWTMLVSPTRATASSVPASGAAASLANDPAVAVASDRGRHAKLGAVIGAIGGGVAGAIMGALIGALIP